MKGYSFKWTLRVYAQIHPSPLFSLILQENSSQFNEQNYLQTHGNPMGTETAVAFANIFMAKIEVQILDKGANKQLVWGLKLSLAHQQIRRQPVH